MRKPISILVFCMQLLMCCSNQVMAQKNADIDSIYNGHFYCESIQTDLFVNPFETNIIVPGYEFIGQTHGYLRGSDQKLFYGVWFIISVEKDHRAIKLRITNDTGADSQTVRLYRDENAEFHLSTLSHNHFTRVVGRKLQKLPSHFVFKRLD